MATPHDKRPRVAIGKLTLLFWIFFLIACGLGYPILNRFDPRQTPGLSDVKTYAALVTDSPTEGAGHVRFRPSERCFTACPRGRL